MGRSRHAIGRHSRMGPTCSVQAQGQASDLVAIVVNPLHRGIVGTEGAVINSGTINASLGGNVALLGRRVENNGLISATLGSVSMAAGKQAVLTFDENSLLGVRVSQEILQNELGVDAAVLNYQ